MPWPGDEGEQRWQQAWTAIKKVSNIRRLSLEVFILVIGLISGHVFQVGSKSGLMPILIFK